MTKTLNYANKNPLSIHANINNLTLHLPHYLTITYLLRFLCAETEQYQIQIKFSFYNANILSIYFTILPFLLKYWVFKNF